MGNRIDEAVIHEFEGKPIVPQHIVTILPVNNDSEAYYVAAIVNSLPFQFAAHAYSQAGGKSFGTPEILEKISVPSFNRHFQTHTRLSDLSRKAHEIAPAAYGGDAQASKNLEEIEAQINTLASRLWGITDTELKELHIALKELKGEDIEPELDDDSEEDG